MDRIEAQRNKVHDLYRRYAEQVRGPACTDDSLWRALEEAQRKLRELEIEASQSDSISGSRNDSPTYRIGDKVQKRSGGSWRGTIVGWYRTALTPDGYAVESAYEPGSVQIYPATALEPWPQPEPSSMPLYLKCLTETAIRPTRASDGSAGLDLYADHSAILSPGERKKIQTGIAVAIAPGYVGMICPRSGMAYHDGVTVLNAPGIIDADYRGEIGVLLINHGDLVYEVVRGMRIAQLLVVPVGVPSLLEVDTLPETARGPAGFGSSGR